MRRALTINFVPLPALHDLDPVFSQFSRKPAMERVAKELIGFHNPLLIQSMYIFKQPRIGGEGAQIHEKAKERRTDPVCYSICCWTVLPHQDSTFLYTEPLSCVAFWFAFEVQFSSPNLISSHAWSSHLRHVVCVMEKTGRHA